MKLHFFRFVIFVQVVLLSFACTIQKRTVKKGYFVQWHWNKNKISQSSHQEQFHLIDSIGLTYESENTIITENEHVYTTSINFNDTEQEVQMLDNEVANSTRIDRLTQTVAKKIPIPLRKIYLKRLMKIEERKKGENKEQWRNFSELFLIISLALLGAFLILFPLYLIKGWAYISPILNVIYFAIPACLLLALVCFICSFIF